MGVLRGGAAVSLAVCVVAVALADAAAYLPKPSEMKGWNEVPGSFVRAEGETLTQLYDGGYQLYLDHGVLEAAQRIYRKGSLYVTVTTHAMKDAKSALAFVGYWARANSHEKKQPTPAPGKGFVMSANGATTVEWARGKVFVTVSVPSASREAGDAARLALKVVARRTR